MEVAEENYGGYIGIHQIEDRWRVHRVLDVPEGGYCVWLLADAAGAPREFPNRESADAESIKLALDNEDEWSPYSADFVEPAPGDPVFGLIAAHEQMEEEENAKWRASQALVKQLSPADPQL
jgi:hypothetical protein